MPRLPTSFFKRPARLAVAVLAALSLTAAAGLVGAQQAAMPAQQEAKSPVKQNTPPKVEAVDIDAYAAKHRPSKPGTRTLLPPQFIGFTARLAEPPRKAKTDYLKTALSILQVAEPPPVSHQMLLLTPGGQRLPVYVEDKLVPVLAAAERREALFVGYHLYTYSKGPAIVVTGYAPKKK